MKIEKRNVNTLRQTKIRTETSNYQHSAVEGELSGGGITDIRSAFNLQNCLQIDQGFLRAKQKVSLESPGTGAPLSDGPINAVESIGASTPEGCKLGSHLFKRELLLVGLKFFSVHGLLGSW
jgi:hypothetical protein